MIFVDTSFFLALALKDDALHERALRWQEALRGELLTTEFVLLEVADHLCQAHLREMACWIVAWVHEDPEFLMVELERADLMRGLSLYRNRSDKDWSLTDCVSFEIMRERGIVDALSHDHHFEQAAFRAPLRGDPPN